MSTLIKNKRCQQNYFILIFFLNELQLLRITRYFSVTNPEKLCWTSQPKITVCSRELAFWQSHMPSVLFTKKLSVVVSLHKQTAWLPWRGVCIPKIQCFVQAMAAEAAQGGLPFFLLQLPRPAGPGERHSHFSGGHTSSGPKSWNHQGWPLTLPGEGQGSVST